jgi:peptidoglycan-N-acetylglucosamine deacetylase
MFYLAKTPWWLRMLYPGCIWQMPAGDNAIYLSFDDGPHPEATPFVLEQLRQYDAKATFFCIGKNVTQYPHIYQQIISEGHAVGNHTEHHLNGWKTPNEKYLADIALASMHINSSLFRPPYGKITKKQLRKIAAAPYGLTTIMWSVLSGDFDNGLSKEKCLDNAIRHTKPGSIVVMHDSEKAFEKIKYVLPVMLKVFSEKGYRFHKIDSGLNREVV